MLLRIPGSWELPFFTQPCVVDYIYYNIQHGLLSLPITSAPVSIPGLPLLESRDMPSFIGVPGSYPAYFKMLLDQFSNTDRVDYILINTFYKLEAEVIYVLHSSKLSLMRSFFYADGAGTSQSLCLFNFN